MEAGKISVLKDIEPLFFPCKECGVNTFHLICKQGHGFTLYVPLTRIQFAHSHRSYFLICPRCSSMNLQITKQHVKLLMDCFVPKDIYQVYTDVSDFYGVNGFNEKEEYLKQVYGEEEIELIKENYKKYKLQV